MQSELIRRLSRASTCNKKPQQQQLSKRTDGTIVHTAHASSSQSVNEPEWMQADNNNERTRERSFDRKSMWLADVQLWPSRGSCGVCSLIIIPRPGAFATQRCQDAERRRRINRLLTLAQNAHTHLLRGGGGYKGECEEEELLWTITIRISRAWPRRKEHPARWLLGGLIAARQRQRRRRRKVKTSPLQITTTSKLNQRRRRQANSISLQPLEADDDSTWSSCTRAFHFSLAAQQVKPKRQSAGQCNKCPPLSCSNVRPACARPLARSVRHANRLGGILSILQHL